MSTTPEREAEAARDQSLFRDVNERVSEFVPSLLPEFLCECTSHDCITPIPIAVEEYEAIRATSNRFLVLPGHVLPDVERVVTETERYAVVEMFGAGAEVAASLDPRRTNAPVSR